MLEILVADDHKLLREGLKPFLRELASDVAILEAANFNETQGAAAAARDLRLILLDLSMPGMNGMRGVETLHGAHPDVPLVILSGDSRRETVLGAVQAGASGFISKTVSGVAMVNALRLVLSGETYLPSSAISEDDYGVETEDGGNLLAGYKRAANILRIEEKKDGPHDRAVDTALLEAPEEHALAAALDQAEPAVKTLLASEAFGPAMAEFAALRPQLDAFFTGVSVNDPRATVRLNRLALLARVRAVMGRVADFARIEG